METVTPKGNETPKKACKPCERLGLRPFTKANILYYYAPLHGLISYGALSVNVMNPSLIIRIVPKKDVTNFLLFHTLLGTTLYIYSRPHLQNVDTPKRLAYSVLGSSLFGFGSILIWAVIRSAISNNNAFTTTVGVVTGFGIARLGYDYLKHVDSGSGSSTSVA